MKEISDLIIMKECSAATMSLISKGGKEGEMERESEAENRQAGSK